MVVPPGNHPATPRDSDLRPACQYVARFETRGRQASGCAKPGSTGARDGLRRKAHPEPLPSSDDRVPPPKLSTTAPPKGLASLSAINAATMRLCRADLPATAPLIAAGSRSHSVAPHRAYSSEGMTAIAAVAAGGSCIMRASKRQEGRWKGSPSRHDRLLVATSP